MAIVFPTVLLWVTEAVPTGVSSLLMIALILVLIPSNVVSSAQLLSFWTSDTMWFLLVCFAFGTIFAKSGLANRLALFIFSLKRLIIVDIAFFGLNILFSFVGMVTSFPKIVILFPLLIGIAALVGMPKEHGLIRHYALMINVLGNMTGLLLYTGFILNPVIGSLGKFSLNYTNWFQWFFVPALTLNLVVFAVTYVLFRPPKGVTQFDPAVIAAQRAKLPKFGAMETKTLVWIVIAIILWSTGSITGIATGFAAVLVVGFMMLPKIGVLTFEEFVKGTNWNMVFFGFGILSIGSLAGTGFAQWIWAGILPKSISASPMILLILLGFLVEILHIPLGSIGSTTSLAIPSLVPYASTFHLAPPLMAFAVYMAIIGQAFFVYQNATYVVGQGFDLWKAKDIFKLGAVMFVILPFIIGVVLYPWWTYLGWITP